MYEEAVSVTFHCLDCVTTFQQHIINSTSMYNIDSIIHDFMKKQGQKEESTKSTITFTLLMVL